MAIKSVFLLLCVKNKMTFEQRCIFLVYLFNVLIFIVLWTSLNIYI